MAIGYEFLRASLKLSAFPLTRPAQVRPVTRVEENDDHLAVPRHVAPASDRPLDHLLFAFKHEGTNLQVAAEALQHIPAADLVTALRLAPTGAFVRKACYLWEQLSGQQLSDLPEVGGPTVQVFDPDRYVTLTARRDARWRVAFNGLGNLRYCATVAKTPAVRAAEASDVLGRVEAFTRGLSRPLLDRALEWAYLGETEGSFAIERETPTQDKADTFMRLLQQAHEPVPVTEDYLVTLQNSVMRNDLAREQQFRTQQNWLRGPLPGALGVTYVPPAPALAIELMDELMTLCERLPRAIDPVTAASVLSFGFVFIHPFMDGNGRLSRFLFHKALCSSGRLASGALLPVSIAMKRNEAAYLDALKSFSTPARRHWEVLWTGADDFQFRFTGQASTYRYWDATACVAFGHRMAEQALDRDLRGETEYLADFDVVLRAVDDRFDIRGSDLTTLLRRCFDQQGRVSNHSRKQFEATVPADAFEFIEEQVKQVLTARRSSERA